MGSEEPDRPRRRPRYRGTHPRSFREKYKEHAPEQYPELVERVRERGQTPAGQHRPILVAEVLEALRVAPGQVGIDATLGYGGHAEALLERLGPNGRLIALDADPREAARAEQRLRALGHGPDRLTVVRTNFAAVGAAAQSLGLHGRLDFLLADLGVSSMQLDDPERGFSSKTDGPLDLRMNPSRGLSAAHWLERHGPEELATALRENADEPHAARLARSLWQHTRQGGAVPRRTLELADFVRATLAGEPAADVERSVRRVFQALRIEVNDEFGALDRLLAELPALLRPGGRAALLSFHSGEDRRVKHAFAQGLAAGHYSAVSDGVLRPSAAEQRTNPRSSSAKLRCAERAPAQ
jgi:16S rRNA (cytosine1402-N4)-methyltransferase